MNIYANRIVIRADKGRLVLLDCSEYTELFAIRVGAWIPEEKCIDIFIGVVKEQVVAMRCSRQ